MTVRRPAPGAAVVALAIALAGAGCSGSPSTSPPATTLPATTLPASTATSAPPATGLYDAACAGALAVAASGTVTATDATELSGVVASRTNPDVLWVHNDSGNDPDVFAVRPSGELVATFTPQGSKNIDWEDIAVGRRDGQSALYLADIGDNAKSRADVVLYRVPEPNVTSRGTSESEPADPQTITTVDSITLTYPDGAHNAEAFLVDPVSGDGVIVTKEEAGPAVIFTIPATALQAGGTAVLTRAGTLDVGPPSLATQVTGADIAPAGDVVAVRTYGGVHLFRRAADQSVAEALAGPPCTGPLPAEIQGEAVGFAADGQSYYTVSEGKRPELHRTTAR